MVDAFTKIILNHELYEATEEDFEELKQYEDPSVIRDYYLFFPIFKDIQIEKKEAKKFSGKIIIKQATEENREGIKQLSNRIFYGEKYEGIKRITDADLNIYFTNGKIFVATVESKYIVGVIITRLGESEGKPCGWESLIIVSRCFRRRGIGEKLFNKLINWSRKNGLTHINTRGLTEDGLNFLLAIKKRKDLIFNLNRFGISSIILK